MERKRIWYNGNIIYELKFGKGLVKEYNYDENFILECEYLNGNRHGTEKNMILMGL